MASWAARLVCLCPLWAELELLPANVGSVCEELRAKLGLRDKSSGLTIDCVRRPTVDFIMVGNGESLGLTGNDATHLDVTAAL